MNGRRDEGRDIWRKPSPANPTPTPCEIACSDHSNAANWPAGSVFSNLHDLSRFVIAMLNGGRLDGKEVLSPQVVMALTSAHAAAPGWDTKHGYGLNVGVSGGQRAWIHGGARAGYGSFIGKFQERQSAVIVLCKRSGQSLDKTAGKIIAMPGGPPLETHSMSDSAIPPGEFARYAGSYRNGANVMHIEVRDGKLVLGARTAEGNRRPAGGEERGRQD